jgi:hypothetical protein
MKLQICAILLATAFAVACDDASFDGDSGKRGGIAEGTKPEPTPGAVASGAPPVAIATPAPSAAPASSPSPSVNPDIPSECQNAALDPGIVDSSTGFTFKLLPDKLGYDEGIAACAAAGPGGRMIYAKQDLPDALLACRIALGTLWLRPDEATDAGSNLRLWQPAVLGEESRETPYWIICYF